MISNSATPGSNEYRRSKVVGSRWGRGMVLWVVLGCICCGALRAQGPPLPPPSQSQATNAPYLTPQRIVRVTESRTINLVCMGVGSPTVVLTAGLGGWSYVWYRIQPTISHATRVCAWDPAGLGFSSPSPEPQDAVHEVQDLETALKTDRLSGPYVMVAHSAGAFVAILFADKHPNDVVGMVLLDPAIPDEPAIRQRIAPKWAASGGGPGAAADHLQQCASELKSGLLKPKTDEYDQCTVSPLPPGFSALSGTIAHLNANSARLLTQASALIHVNADSPREAINPHRSYGDMPMIVLTAGQHPFPPDMPSDIRQEIKSYFQALAAAHRAYAALSTHGKDEIVGDSAHFIQFDDPTAVIAATESLLVDIRNNAPRRAAAH